MRVRRIGPALALVGLVIAGVSSVSIASSSPSLRRAAASSAQAAPYCGITWGSTDKTAGTLSPAPLVDARTGQHDCYDRVTFEFNGPAKGYRVVYATSVPAEGSGAPLPVAGAAKLYIQLLDPAYNASGSTYPHNVRDHVANVTGYRTFRDLVYGGSFEGYTTFGLGVRARLPFRAFILAGPGTHSRMVVDVAHQW